MSDWLISGHLRRLLCVTFYCLQLAFKEYITYLYAPKSKSELADIKPYDPQHLRPFRANTLLAENRMSAKCMVAWMCSEGTHNKVHTITPTYEGGILGRM